MVTEQTLGNADNSKHGILFGHISSNHYFVTWNIVAVYIDDKTAVDDRRHCTSLNSSGDDDFVVNMALATSLADLFRQCEQVAIGREPLLTCQHIPGFYTNFGLQQKHWQT